MSEDAKLRLALKMPWAATALMDIFIASQWASMLTTREVSEPGMIGWTAITLAMLLWVTVYSTITPGQKVRVLWAWGSALNAALGLAIAILFSTPTIGG